MATPTIPQRFYGNVTFNGDSVSDCNIIHAKIRGIEVANVSTIGGNYGLGPEYLDVEGIDGDTIEIFVNDFNVANYTLNVGEITKLDLVAEDNIKCPDPQVINTGIGGGGGGGGGGGTNPPNTANSDQTNLGDSMTTTTTSNDYISQKGGLSLGNNENEVQDQSKSYLWMIIGGIVFFVLLIVIVMVIIIIRAKKQTDTNNLNQSSS